MRINGAKTKKICWRVTVKINNDIVFLKEYTSLKNVGEDLGFTYNRVSELATGRIKQKDGVFEPTYIFDKL